MVRLKLNLTFFGVFRVFPGCYNPIFYWHQLNSEKIVNPIPHHLQNTRFSKFWN